MNLIKKLIEDMNGLDNLYIIKVSNNKDELIKLGYSSDIRKRLIAYYYHNPLIEIIGLYYREDAKEFEHRLHKVMQSEILNEWYSVDKLDSIREYIENGIPDDLCINIPKPEKTSFIKLCESYDALDLFDKLNIDKVEPFIKVAYDNFTFKELKAMEFRKNEINEALLVKNQFNINNYKITHLLDYRVGEWISCADIKSRLAVIYNQLGINYNAKATDITNYYIAELKSKKIEKKTVKGYQILSEKVIIKK
jgi:hypothetical protein